MELSDGSRVCLDCEAIFVIEDGEKKYFDDHNLTMPRRCRTCCQLRKDLAHQADVAHAREVLGVTASPARSTRARPDNLMRVGLEKHKHDHAGHGDIQPDRKRDACEASVLSEPLAEAQE